MSNLGILRPYDILSNHAIDCNFQFNIKKSNKITSSQIEDTFQACFKHSDQSKTPTTQYSITFKTF